MRLLSNHLARKHLFYVIVCSSCFAVIIICIQLYIDYRKDVAEIDKDLAMIKRSYIPSVISSRYNFDNEQFMLLLSGIMELRDIVYVEVSQKARDNNKVLAFIGDPEAPRDITGNYPLIYQSKTQKIDMGTLYVYASLESVNSSTSDSAIG